MAIVGTVGLAITLAWTILGILSRPFRGAGMRRSYSGCFTDIGSSPSAFHIRSQNRVASLVMSC